MAESGNSNTASVVPGYSSDRFKKPTWSVKVNSVVVDDAILERVDIGYGSDMSSAVFTLPRSPSSSGLPAKNDLVEIIVNGKSLFKGKIKIIGKHIGRDGLRVTYTAYSNITDRNKNVVLSGSFNSDNSDYPGILFTVKGIFNRLGIPVENSPNVYPGDVDVTDQTELAAVESVLAKVGNYKLYYDMSDDSMEVYELGSGGVNQRSFLTGRTVLDMDMNVSVENIVSKVTVVGPPTQITRRIPVTAGSLQTDSNGRRMVAFSLSGKNIRDIVVEGLTREQPKLEFSTNNVVSRAMLINPDPSLPEMSYDFDTDTPKFKYAVDEDDFKLRKVVLSHLNHSTGWSVMPVNIEQNGSDSVTVFLGEVPKIWYAKTIKGMVSNKVLDITPASGESTVEIFDSYGYRVGALRVTYTVDGDRPVAWSGSGDIVRSITDSQYQIVINYATGYNNSSFVLAEMQNRAAAELDKLNVPEISGTFRILGDETVGLKQSVIFDSEVLDIMHVTHNFTRGFTTDVVVTNEKLRFNYVGSVVLSGEGGRSRGLDTERDRRRNLLIRNSQSDILRKKNQQSESEEKQGGEESPTPGYGVYRGSV